MTNVLNINGRSRPGAKGGERGGLLALLAFLSSVISSIFAQNKGGRIQAVIQFDWEIRGESDRLQLLPWESYSINKVL